MFELKKILQRPAMEFGRRFKFRGVGRLIQLIFPVGRDAKRYLSGWYPRADGLSMLLDSRNWIDWNILFRGAFEPELDEMIEKVLPPGGVALDVGANIGAHTLTMARVVGPGGGEVLAFEPNPQVLEVLKSNIEANGLESVACAYGCGLGDKESKMQLRVPMPDSEEASQLGLASFVALNTPHTLVEVQVRTVDEIAMERDIKRLDFVKIDVQGFECQVLRGMQRTLERFRPVVVFEYERWAWAEGQGDLRQAMEVFQKAGYAVWHLSGHGASIIEAESMNDLPDHVDLIAVPQHDKRAQVLGLESRPER